MCPRLPRQCAAEFIGTFALCFVGILAVKNNPDLLSIAVAQGLTIAAMVAAFAGISGGHFNPAISLTMLAAGRLEWRRAMAYVGSQLAGGVTAGFLLVNMFSDTGKTMVAAGTPELGAGVTLLQGIAIEAVLTFFLALVYLGVPMERTAAVGGLAVGITVTFDILAGGPISGGALNPARAFGPALASNHWNQHLVHWVGPLLGGAVAGTLGGRWLMCEKE